MIRFGESCLYSVRGRCFNKAAEHHGRPCPHVGEQFCCPWYNGTIPRVSCAEPAAGKVAKKEILKGKLVKNDIEKDRWSS